jgi:hypothetical protein
MKPVIIIPAFSRPLALSRLLESINRSHFPSDEVKLIVSIDGGASKDVEQVAKKFIFLHGNHEVISRENNMGLRKHILWCGDQTEKYEAVIVLEDDLYVDPYFYIYATSCLDFYKDDNNVSGIALYSPRHNQYAGLPFEPIYNGTSTYFMQVPCSWGQAWTKKQWQEFREWYEDGKIEKVNKCLNIPKKVKSWSENSWKKYFAAYLVERNRYFVYPYISYSTNCSDAGGIHLKKGTNLFQVPLAYPSRKIEKLEFDYLESTIVSYDSFMEPSAEWMEKSLGLNHNSLTVDLYSSKNDEILNSKPLCLTSQKFGNLISRYPLSYRPIELNILAPKNEQSVSLYLVSTKSEKLKQRKLSIKLYQYNSYFYIWSKKFILSYLINLPKEILKEIIKGIKTHINIY